VAVFMPLPVGPVVMFRDIMAELMHSVSMFYIYNA